MKLVKMSLVAAMLMGVSAFAIDNTKVSGDARLYYGTNDADYMAVGSTKASLFDKSSSYGQAALGLGVTTDLLDHVSAGAHLTALTTLGLQGQLVNNIWEATNGLDDYYWFDEAWIAATLGKTTLKVGRMQLDTPLVFSETWSIATNTFGAAVLLNQDLPDTTLVGAYVGESNGNVASMLNFGVAAGAVVGGVNANGTTNFSQFYNGAYAIGIVNNSVKPLTLQAWYYDATEAVQAYWLEADLAMDQVILFGAQYTSTDYQKNLLKVITADPTWNSHESNDAYAVMLGFKLKDVATLKASYSQVGKNDTLGVSAGQNLATNPTGGSQSKLYTEAWWNYGYITRNDTSAWNITATASAAGADFGAYYTSSTTKVSGASDVNMNELTLTAGKDFGPLNTTLAYIYTDADDQNVDAGGDAKAYNTLQVYLTLNF